MAAQAALTERRFREAHSNAETLLQGRVPRDVRGAALLVAADAAYGMRWYREAAGRYREFVSKHGERPEAARAAMALGWAQLRDGERARARRSWGQAAEKFPRDPRAPLALLLASQTGDGSGAGALLDRLIAQYPSTPHAGTARLNRSMLALREGREDAAVRDLDEAIRSHGVSVIDLRRRTTAALASPEGEAALDTPAPLAGAPGPSIERFAASLQHAGDPEGLPYLLHGLSLLAAANSGWSDALVAKLVHRLVDESPAYPSAPTLLARVATSAVSAGQWPTARRAYETLVRQYPQSPVTASARMQWAEGLIRAGAKADARAPLEDAAAAGGDDRPRALRLLADVEEALGNRERARRLLQQVVEADDGELASEAAYRVGRMLSADGQHTAALEWHLTAAYLAENSRWGRQALLDAGRSLTALNKPNEALVLYRKLMPKAFARGARGGALPPASPPVGQRDDRAVMGEAAYRIAEIVGGIGDHEAALDMYLTAAHLTTGAAAERRALLGAMRSLVTMGDRASAEAIYRRLLERKDTEPALLAEARKVLRGRGGMAQDGNGAAALPRSVQDD
jgi:TolA-binding protein